MLNENRRKSPLRRNLTGFNAGYSLPQNDQKLAQMLSKIDHTKYDYFKAMAAGSEEYQREMFLKN